MSDSNDLLNKADALLSKYRGVAKADIPVLTDIVEPENGSSPYDSHGHVDSESPAYCAEQADSLVNHQVWEAIQPYLSSFLGEPLEMRIKNQLIAAGDRIAAEIAMSIQSDIKELVDKAVIAAIEGEKSNHKRLPLDDLETK